MSDRHPNIPLGSGAARSDRCRGTVLAPNGGSQARAPRPGPPDQHPGPGRSLEGPMDDVRVYVDLPDHAKTRALSARLDCGIPAAVGLVVTLWAHVRKVAPSGELPGASPADIARWARFDGDAEALAMALVASCPGYRRGFLQSLPDGGFRVVGWLERQPLAARTHALDRLNLGRPAEARSEAARKAGKASAAKRAALGWTRDPKGRWHAPQPNGSPNDIRTTTTERLTERETTQPIATPNAARTTSERSSPLLKNPPPPHRTPDFSLPPSRRADPGPRPSDTNGQAHAALLAEQRRDVEAIAAKATAGLPTTPRERRFARAAHARLLAQGLPLDPLPDAVLRDPAPATAAEPVTAPPDPDLEALPLPGGST